MRIVFLFLFLFTQFIQSFEGYFYLSYRVVSQNSVFYNERINVSRVMYLPENLERVGSFKLDVDEEKIKVRDFFRIYQDEINREMFKSGVFINDNSSVKKSSQKSKSVLTLPPTIVHLSVKDNFANITIYK